MRKSLFLILLSTGVAAAHPHIDGGPALASKGGQLITFGISHGCGGKDTVKIVVTIPAGVTGVRAFYGPFGAPSVTTDANNNVTSVTWEKATFEPVDKTYPQFTIRATIADVPFTSIMFPVEQTCLDGTGPTVVNWNEPDDTNGKEAPKLKVVPARVAGWNKLTVPVAIAEDDLPAYFGDAQILWKGTAAYTPNGAVAALITMTPGVSALSGGLSAGDEIWVKY